MALEFQMIKLEVNDMVVVLVYRSPSFANVDKFQEWLVKLVQNERGSVIICGDFNIDPVAEKMKYDRLQAVMNGMGLSQIVNRPTHLSGHTLDHVYINRKLQLKYFNLHHPYYSDHDSTLVIVEEK